MKRVLIPTLIISIVIIIIFVSFPQVEFYFQQLIESRSNGSKHLYVLLGFLILSSDFLLPIPSTLLMFSNGMILGFFEGFLLSLLASMCSSSLGYYLGKTAHKRVDRMYSEVEVQKAEVFINQFGEVGLILSRGIPILSEATSIVCGNMAFKFKRFLIANLIGYVPVCAMYAYLGSIAVSRDVFLMALLVNFIIAGGFWFMKDFFYKKDRLGSMN